MNEADRRRLRQRNKRKRRDGKVAIKAALDKLKQLSERVIQVLPEQPPPCNTTK